MPYISPEDREHISKRLPIDFVSGILRNVPSDKPKGALNYFICNLIVYTMKPSDGWTYESLTNAISVCCDVEHELRRRLLDPYEDKAIEKNGDIFRVTDSNNR